MKDKFNKIVIRRFKKQRIIKFIKSFRKKNKKYDSIHFSDIETRILSNSR